MIACSPSFVITASPHFFLDTEAFPSCVHVVSVFLCTSATTTRVMNFFCTCVQELGLESAALGGTGGGSVVAGIVDELVKEGALAGAWSCVFVNL